MSALKNQTENMTEAKVNETIVPTETVEAPSKASKALPIFLNMYVQKLDGKIARKDVIGAMIKASSLTKHGAATYYQNYVTKFKAGKFVRQGSVLVVAKKAS